MAEKLIAFPEQDAARIGAVVRRVEQQPRGKRSEGRGRPHYYDIPPFIKGYLQGHLNKDQPIAGLDISWAPMWGKDAIDVYWPGIGEAFAGEFVIAGWMAQTQRYEVILAPCDDEESPYSGDL